VSLEQRHLLTAPPSAFGATSGRDGDIRRILAVARSIVGFDVAWLSRFDSQQQTFTHVSSRGAASGPAEGTSGDLDGSYCVRVLDGRLPAVVPDVREEPVVRDLPVTAELGIGAYAGVPVLDRDGRVHGMLCCSHGTAVGQVGERGHRTLEMLAQVIGALLDDEAGAHDEHQRARVQEVVQGIGRSVVLQPIVDIRTGRAIGAEALSRFTEEPYRPDLWFALAEAVGLLLPLDLAAARSALLRLDGRTGYLSLNLSPDTVLAGGCDLLLDGIDRRRVVVEITEHAQVADYAALHEALEPHRAAGLRLAVDDAGAGYASFRHILALRPDFIKVDLSLVRDIHLDPVRQALTSSLLTFAQTAGATLVAEGVETQDELDTLARLGVTLMQGYHLGRPTASPAQDGYPQPSPHVLVGDGTDLSLVLADALRRRSDPAGMTRPLLEAVLSLTGLETSALTVLHDEQQLEHRYVRNAGSIDVPEGATLPWSQALCSSMQAKGMVWTNDAARDLADRPAAAAEGVVTFLTSPVTDLDGALLGTLCAVSRQPVYISEATVAQVQLIAHVLGRELSTRERGTHTERDGASARAVRHLRLRPGTADALVPVVPADDVERRRLRPPHLGHLTLAREVPHVTAGDGDAITDDSPHATSQVR
jgi:EAL domain-containing protein (putative c-di-GMP-specific phosphodiesterase class I)